MGSLGPALALVLPGLWFVFCASHYSDPDNFDKLMEARRRSALLTPDRWEKDYEQQKRALPIFGAIGVVMIVAGVVVNFTGQAKSAAPMRCSPRCQPSTPTAQPPGSTAYRRQRDVSCASTSLDSRDCDPADAPLLRRLETRVTDADSSNAAPATAKPSFIAVRPLTAAATR